MKHNLTFLSTLLATIFLVGNALAETKSCGTNCIYTIDNGNLSISTQDQEREASIGYRAFFGNTSATGTLVIPSNVQSIDYQAFHGMSNITSLVFDSPETSALTSIGDGAFNGMSSFSGPLVLPDSIQSIGSEAFRGLPNATNITLPASLQSIGYRAFFGSSSAGALVIPSNVQSIDSQAFHGMSNITSLVFDSPETSALTSIGDGAFNGMSSATGPLVLPDSIQSIGREAFRGLHNVTSLTLPDSIQSIGERAFFEMNSVTGPLVIPSTIQSIGYQAFYGMNLVSQIYCEGTVCDYINANRNTIGIGSKELVPYTKDENGLYKIGDKLYLSASDHQAGKSCGKSSNECMLLADLIKSGTNCNSISSCKTYLTTEKYHGSPLLYGKKIYTVEEAMEATKDGERFHVGLTYK